MTDDKITISPGPNFMAAMLLAVAADALQLVVFPMFVEGALSPADDVLDLGVGALMVHLLGWHWEFLPTFFAELVPGVDLVPFWTLAVANVYRKWKQTVVITEERREERPALKGQQIPCCDQIEGRMPSSKSELEDRLARYRQIKDQRDGEEVRASLPL